MNWRSWWKQRGGPREDCLLSGTGNGNAQKAFDELVAILDDKFVVNAVDALQPYSCPSHEPHIVPQDVVEAEQALHKALPGS